MLAESRDVEDALAWRPCGRDAWEARFRATGRSSLEQSWAYGEAVAAQHRQSVERHLLTCGGQPVALLQAFRRRYGPLQVTRILRGPLWLIDPLHDARATVACAGIARRYRGRALDFLSWLPELPDDPRSAALLEAQGLHRVVTGYASVWLDLRPGAETLLAGLHGKWRAALRKAERSGLTVRMDARGRQQKGTLLLYDTFRRKKRFVGPSGDFVAAVAAADRDALLSLSAHQGKELVAGVVLLRHGASATYVASWTGAAGRSAQAHNLLLWQGIERLKQSGVEWLDLGGLNTESQQGLARFKLGLGGETFILSGSYL